MFDSNMIKITTKEALGLDEFYEKIKDLPFEAGKPEYIRHGSNYVIAFPKEDRANQVWITKVKDGFAIQRSTIIADPGEMVANALRGDMYGFAGAISMFGGAKNRCLIHISDAAEKIKALDL